MKNFKEYINESTFSGASAVPKYIEPLCKEIKQGKSILLGKKGETEAVIVYDDNVKKLEKTNSNKEALALLQPLGKGSSYSEFFTTADGKKIQWTDIFKGYFSQGNPKEGNVIKFNGTTNTNMGESLQILGFFVNKNIVEDSMAYGDTNYKKLISTYKSLPDLLEIDSTISMYLKDEETFDRYALSLRTILKASYIAQKEISKKIKFTGAIHSSIDKYYNILKERGLVSSSITKENTADCVLYTKDSFLEDLANPDNVIDYSDYCINIVHNSKVINSFIQISLKASGRLGDLATFTKLSNNHKYFMYEKYGIYNESFGSWIKMLGQAALNWTQAKYKSLVKSIEKFTSSFSKFGFDKRGKNIAIDLFYGTNESSKKGLPKEEAIIEKYSDEAEYKKLTDKIELSIRNIKKLIDNLGSGAIYSIPDFKYPKKMDKKTVRFVYFNAVSVLIMEEFLEKQKGNSFLNIEREAVYGNTLMPLVKVSTDVSAPIEFLPIKNSDVSKSTFPSFLFKLNISSNSYYSFYFYVISNIKTTSDEIVYIQIQMRTKGSSQYVVDAQSYKTYDNVMKNFY